MSKRLKSYKVGNLFFDSCFDSGNLSTVYQRDDGVFVCELTPDECTSFRAWFFFSVSSCTEGELLKFEITGFVDQSVLFNTYQHKPCISNSMTGQYSRLPLPATLVPSSTGYSLHFKVRVPPLSSTIYLSYTFPYQLERLSSILIALETSISRGNRCDPSLHHDELSTSSSENNIYFGCEILTRSLENRDVFLLTITSEDGLESAHMPLINGLFPAALHDGKISTLDRVDKPAFLRPTVRPNMFSGKRSIFISARVHPGETASSHMLDGLLELLLRKDDPRSIALRKKFVFFIVPILNPDGVFNGHFRFDTRGINLNRCYTNPNRDLQPTIYAAKVSFAPWASGLGRSTARTSTTIACNSCR